MALRRSVEQIVFSGCAVLGGAEHWPAVGLAARAIILKPDAPSEMHERSSASGMPAS
jgi:hypothetical protein